MHYFALRCIVLNCFACRWVVLFRFGWWSRLCGALLWLVLLLLCGRLVVVCGTVMAEEGVGVWVVG